MRFFLFSGLFFLNVSFAEKLHISPYIDGIKSCKKLASETFDVDLNHSEFRMNTYRGTQYTPLYMSLRLNCLAVGRDMLQRHANPNVGGYSGSLLYSALSLKNDEMAVAWTMMLMGGGADPFYRNNWIENSVNQYVDEAYQSGGINKSAYSLYKKAIATEDFPY